MRLNPIGILTAAFFLAACGPELDRGTHEPESTNGASAGTTSGCASGMCVPDLEPPTGAGSTSGSSGGIEECELDGCELGEICVTGVVGNQCQVMAAAAWDVQFDIGSYECTSGGLGCDLMYLGYLWNRATQEWDANLLGNLSGLLPGDRISLSVFERDPTVEMGGVWLTDFEIAVGDGIEAWKVGDGLTVFGTNGRDSMTFRLTPSCLDACDTVRDGVCGDGGSGASNSDCRSGTDCTDCGVR